MRRPLVLLMAALPVIVAGGVRAGGDDAEHEKAGALMRAQKWSEAASLLEEMTRAQPDDVYAWFDLASARYRLGDIDGSITAGLECAKHPHVRGSALYNVACGYGIKGDADRAAEVLEHAVAEGFLDFDLMKTDPDLAVLRETGLLVLPEGSEYTTFTAPNGVTIPYRVVLPEGHDAAKTYPAFVTFAPGGGPLSADWAIEHVWGDEPRSRGWIAVHLAAPEQGWMTHPSHHALEDLLDEVLEHHEIEGDTFHLVAFAGGCRPAATYSGMAGKYFKSLTVVGSRAWSRWDDEDISDMRADNIFLVVGGQDTFGVEQNRRAKALLDKTKHHVTLEVVDGEGMLPRPMFGGGLMRYLDDRVRRGASS